jgi:hypothetical protein
MWTWGRGFTLPKEAPCCSIAPPAGVREERISKGLARVSDDGGDRIHGRGALGSAETTVLMSVEETFEALAKGKGIGYHRPGE